ncbi:hypothetical protein Tco_0584999 [Tanacetum coccineum]
MANPPPNDLNANLLEDEPVQPEHAPIMLGFAPAMLNLPNNNNRWIEEEKDEEEKEVEEEMEAEEDEEIEVEVNDDDNDAQITYPYEEADPLNRPPPSPETAEQEFMNALISEGSSATVFNPTLCRVNPPGPIGNDPNTLYSKVKTWTKQMWDMYRVESSSFKRLRRNDMRMDSFDDDLTALDSTLRKQIQEMKKLMAKLNEQFQQIQERDLRAENEMLRIRLRAAEEKAEDQHIDAEYYKNHWARVSQLFDDLSRWESKIRDQLPLKKRYRETPYDPSTDTTSRPRRDDPYDTANDSAATAPTKEDDEDPTIPSDP